MSERRPARTIGELDIHLGHMQDGLQALREAVDQMATRKDIEALASRMDTLATKEELKAVEKRLDDESADGTLSKFANLAIRLLAVFALLGAIGGAATVVYKAVDAAQVAKP